jgi:hypothetical protein
VHLLRILRHGTFPCVRTVLFLSVFMHAHTLPSITLSVTLYTVEQFASFLNRVSELRYLVKKNWLFTSFLSTFCFKAQIENNGQQFDDIFIREYIGLVVVEQYNF